MLHGFCHTRHIVSKVSYNKTAPNSHYYYPERLFRCANRILHTQVHQTSVWDIVLAILMGTLFSKRLLTPKQLTVKCSHYYSHQGSIQMCLCDFCLQQLTSPLNYCPLKSRLLLCFVFLFSNDFFHQNA